MGEILFPPGVKPLSEVNRARTTIALGGPTGIGKTVGAASFGGGEWGKILWFDIESGPVDAAGGATSLLHLDTIHPRIKAADILILPVRSWYDMERHFTWVRENASALTDEGYAVMVWDSGTELGKHISRDTTAIDLKKLPGYKSGDDADALANSKRTLIPDLLGECTRKVNWDDYGIFIEKFQNAIVAAKSLPFTLVVTFADDVVYDDATGKRVIGIGPDMPGRKLGAQIPFWFNCYFHCEQEMGPDKKVKYVWLTRNNPQLAGNPNQYIAKHRYGDALAVREPADGAALLAKVGVKPPGRAK